MLTTLASFVRWSAPYRARYGHIAGTRFALQWRRASYAAEPGTPVRLDVPDARHPLYLRAGTIDLRVFDQIFCRHEVAFPVAAEPQVIVDAGANIGLSTIYFANRWPEARIISLEVDSGNHALLCRNTIHYPQVQPLLCGLWSRPTELVITNPDVPPWGFVVSSDLAEGPPGAATVPAVGVAELMEQQGLEQIDLLKIDIEGAEREVFGVDAERWIDRVRCIAVELHDRFFPGCAEALDRAVGRREMHRQEVAEYVILTRV